MLGLEVREGKNLAFRTVGEDRYIRATTLGYRYHDSTIKERISLNSIDHNRNLHHGLANDLIGVPAPKHRLPVQFYKLKLAANALNYLVDQGIDSYELLEQRQKEWSVALQNTKEKIRELESRINEQSAIGKQLNVLEANPYSKPFPNRDSNFKDHQALAKAAIRYLHDRSIEPPYPSIKSIDNDLEQLRKQVADLYQSYDQIKQNQIQLQSARSQVDRALKRSNEAAHEKSK
jgi:prefoldin subunit 5